MRLHFECKTIYHSKHRYKTCGDFFFKGAKMVIVASRMSHPGYSLAIIIHEMVEFVLCRMHGVKEKDITAFDLKHGMEQDCGTRPENEEPGDAWDCPYRQEHQRATHVERAVIAAFDLSWAQYDKEIEKLFD